MAAPAIRGRLVAYTNISDTIDLDNKSLYDICFLKTNQMAERDTSPDEHRAVRVASRAARRYASEL